MLRTVSVVALAAALLGACASERTLDRAEWFGQASPGVTKREILHNLSMMIYDINHIPTRTTVSDQINFDFTDKAAFSVTAPLNNLARPSGKIDANLGELIDNYKLNVTTEDDPFALRGLRDLYRWAIYPNDFDKPDLQFAARYNVPWLYWTNRGFGQSPADRPPPASAIYVGSSKFHDFYASERNAFSELYLNVLGGGFDLKGQPSKLARILPHPAEKKGDATAPTPRPQRSTTPSARPSGGSAVPPPNKPSRPTDNSNKLFLVQ